MENCIRKLLISDRCSCSLSKYLDAGNIEGIFRKIYAPVRRRAMAVCAIAFEPQPWMLSNYFLDQIGGINEFKRAMKEGLIEPEEAL